MKIVAEFPAFIYFEDENREYQSGDIVAVPYQSKRYGTLYTHHTLGCVEDYAIKRGYDVVEEVERAKKHGHELYYAFANATIISSSPRDREAYPTVTPGTIIKFKGKKFEIIRTPNNNIGLKEVSDAS